MRQLRVMALVGVFLAAIVAANLTLTHWGPQWIVPNALLLIGLDFVTRDRLADLWGTRRALKMILLIAAGGALSYWLNRDAGRIAVASCVSFAAAELVESVAYHLMRRHVWSARAPRSAVVAAAVDSILFPTLAFGSFAFLTSLNQFCAKVAGAVIWTWVLLYVTHPPEIAPAAPEAA